MLITILLCLNFTFTRVRILGTYERGQCRWPNLLQWWRKYVCIPSVAGAIIFEFHRWCCVWHVGRFGYSGRCLRKRHHVKKSRIETMCSEPSLCERTKTPEVAHWPRVVICTSIWIITTYSCDQPLLSVFIRKMYVYIMPNFCLSAVWISCWQYKTIDQGSEQSMHRK